MRRGEQSLKTHNTERVKIKRTSMETNTNKPDSGHTR